MRRILGVVAVAGLVAGGSLVALTGTSGAGLAPVIPVTITKTVTGTDPGVAFPIVLTCSSEPVGAEEVDTTDITIPNNGLITETVQLKNGESTTVQVTLPDLLPVTASCTVTEDPAGAELPDGYTCTPSITAEVAVDLTPVTKATSGPLEPSPLPVVLYDDRSRQVATEAGFTVTNTCALVKPITFTG